MNKLWSLMVAGSVAVLVSAAGAIAQPLEIVKDGVSNYEILLAKDALPITFRAAQDLQLYVKKATGAQLPIRQGETVADRPAILVGDGLVAKDFLDGVAPEGFRIKTVGRNLVIAGRDTANWGAESVHWRGAPQAGTWHGVSQFLEQELGIRWFYPGEMGEYVPKTAGLTVKEQDFSDAPKMVLRNMSYLYTNSTPPARQKEVNEWGRRNRKGWSLVWSASHVWLEYFKGETYFKDHPDWFALVNGRRLAHNVHGLQMCTTNPEALDEFARVIIKYAKENPGIMFSLTPNDGGNFCECDRCRALDRQKYPNGQPILTDRIMTYANEIAARVCKVVPDQKFGLDAYSFYADPPTYVKLHPNIYIMNVKNDTARTYYSLADRTDHLQKQLIPWRAMLPGFFAFYSHPEGYGNLDLPSGHAQVIGWTFENLNKVDAKGFMMNMGDSFVGAGLNHYLYLRMTWNPGADFKAVYADAIDKCYGPAAPFVREYFDIVERRAARNAESAADNADIAMGVVRTFPRIIDTIYGGFYDEAAPLLKKALAAGGDAGQRQRVQWLADNLEYTRMTVELYDSWKKLQGNAKATTDDWRKARDLCVKRAEEIRKLNDTNLHMAGMCDRLTQMFSLPFVADVYDRMLIEAAGGKSKVTVTRAAAAPKLEAGLADPAWAAATEMPVEFRKDDSSRATIKTRARVLYDSAALYIAIRCDDPAVKEIKDSCVKRDGSVWEENCVDMFIDTGNNGQTVRQLIVNSLGTPADFQYPPGVKQADWDSQVRTAVQKDGAGWTVTMAIPLAALGVEKITPGDVWGFNVCRVRTTCKPPEYTCWSPTFGLFNQPKRFGYLIFK